VNSANALFPEKHSVNVLTTIQFVGLFGHKPSHSVSVACA